MSGARQVHVLMGSRGEYSDRDDYPLIAFESEAAADALCAKLNALREQRDAVKAEWNSEPRRIANAYADAQARELGFPDGMPGDWFTVATVELRHA